MKKTTKKAAKAKAAPKKPAPRGSKTDAPGTVTIRDAGLRRGLELVLRRGAVQGLQVDRQALAGVSAIDWSEDYAEAFPDQWKSIGDLKGLEHATSLRKLTIWGNSISSLAPLANLTELEEVWAFNNHIETTAGLANKPKLRALHLNYNPIESIAELRGLPALEQLELSEAKVADLSPLLDLPKLRKLDVWGMEKARAGRNLAVLATLAARQVVIRMDAETQKGFDEELAKALIKQPSADPVLERFRQLAQPALALLWKRAGAAAKDGDWNTLLHRVVLLEDKDLPKGGADAARVDLIKELARAGVAVDARNDDYGNHTALSLAVDKGRSPAVIQALLDAGASPRLPRRRPALAVALEKGAAPAVLEKLVAAGADVTPPAVLERAADRGAVDLVAPVARAIDWRKQVHQGTPALANAVYRKDDRMVDLLLDAGAPAAAGANYPAVFYVHTVAMLDKLIAHGADPLVHTTYGTALHNLRRSSPEALQLIDRFIDLGVPVDARNYEGRTALSAMAADGADYVKGKWTFKPAVLAVTQKLIARGADPSVRIWSPDVVEWPEARTLLDASREGDLIRQLGGVTTAVWARRLVKVVAGAKALEGEALQALTELALAGLLTKLDADLPRIERQVRSLLAARTDAVSTALVPLGVHPLTLLWLSRGVHGRDLFDRGMLQIAADLRIEGKEGPAKIHPLLRALCDQGAPVDVRDARGDAALDTYVGKARIYKFALDTSLVKALMPKSPALITAALVALCRSSEPLTSEQDAALNLIVEAGADLTEPQAFAALCHTRRPDLVRRALDAGADPAWEAEGDHSALEKALAVDDVPIVEMLLEAGTPPDIGWEATSVAFHQTRSPEAYDLLLRYKLDPSLRGGHDRQTIFDEAINRTVYLLGTWDGHDWSGTGKDARVRDAAARFLAHLIASGWSLDSVDPAGKTPRSRLKSIESELGRAVLARAGVVY